jgi:hypothetical protein
MGGGGPRRKARRDCLSCYFLSVEQEGTPPKAPSLLIGCKLRFPPTKSEDGNDRERKRNMKVGLVVSLGLSDVFGGG